jgi:hypothetical protein
LRFYQYSYFVPVGGNWLYFSSLSLHIVMNKYLLGKEEERAMSKVIGFFVTKMSFYTKII